MAFSGAFLSPRAELAGRARAAGLLPVADVGAGTALLVANDAGSGAEQVRRALALRVRIVDEYTFEALLAAAARG